MTDTTMMTEQTATTTTEGQAASAAESNPATTAPGQAGEQSATQQQTTEGQGTNEQGANTEGDQGSTENKDDKGEKQGAPEKYEFSTPEGVELDQSVLGKFSEVAKKHNLTQDVAQDILSEMAPQLAAQQAEQFQAIRTQWVDQAKADKEFGGDGLQENLAVAKKAMDAFGSPELRELLNKSGFGDNPEVVRFFYRAGKAISEDKLVVGGRGDQNTSDSPAKRLFPNQN
jgi:hypothetical protein